MNNQALYESDGNAAVKVDAPHPFDDCERIIQFPGNVSPDSEPKVFASGEPFASSVTRESIAVEGVFLETEYVEARHLFYWMTDEDPAELRAQHGPEMSAVQREVCRRAGRVQNALVNHPLICGSTPEASRPGASIEMGKGQTAAILAASMVAAVIAASVGL